VLDDAKHYWVSIEEVDKLIRADGDCSPQPAIAASAGARAG